MDGSTSLQSSASEGDYFYGWSKEYIKTLVGGNFDDLPKEPHNFVLLYSAEGEKDGALYQTLFTNWSTEERQLKPRLKQIKKLYQILVSLQYQKYTVFNDPIHGTVQLHPLLTNITKTRAFDRLKHIKQLGLKHYVYHGATHSRFEHSIGTCYIAGEFVRMLQRQQPELGITDKQVLCVEIAGLCHDLGHGPFSHLFKKVVKKLTGNKFKHEKLSTSVFEHCIWEDECSKEFEKYGFTRSDLETIKKLIDHDLDKLEPEEQKKRYLYEIVANKATGIDVDKWDYFARDCHYLGIQNEFQWRRLMAMGRVVHVVEENQESNRICYRNKAVNDIYGMFRTRSSLYQRALEHKTVISVEHMIASAIVMAGNEKLLLVCPRATLVSTRMSVSEVIEKAREDPPELEGFLALTDNIFDLILYAPVDKQAETSTASSDTEKTPLEKAQDLLRRIAPRKLFHLVIDTEPNDLEISEKDIVDEFEGDLKEEDIYVESFSISYGSEDHKDKDPVERVYFYEKTNPTEASKPTEKQPFRSKLVLPQAFEENIRRVYSGKKKDLDERIKNAYKKAKEKKKKMQIQQEVNVQTRDS